MSSFISPFIVSRFVILAFFISFIVILYRNSRNHPSVQFRDLYGVFILGTLFNIGLIINDYLAYIGIYVKNSTSWFIFFTFLDQIFICQFILLFVFIEHIRHPSISGKKILVFSSFLFFNLSNNILLILQGLDDIVITFTQMPLNASIAVTFTFISINYYQIWKKQKSRLLFVELVGSIVLSSSNFLQLIDFYKVLEDAGYISVSSSFVDFWQNLSWVNLVIVQPLIIFVFVVVVMIDIDIVYRSSLEIQDIFIFHTSGISLYGIGKNKMESSLDQQLFAGFVSAMNSFIQEMKPKKGEEFLSQMKSTHRFVEIVFGHRIGIAMVTNQLSYYTRLQLRNMIAEMEDNVQLSNEISASTGLDDDIVRSILKKNCPYIDISGMETY